MQDRLKEYVESRRDELEVYQPREDLWAGVSDRLQHGRRSALWKRLAIAASVLLVVTCGAWLFWSGRQNTGVVSISNPSQMPIAKAEVYFASILQMKDAELKQYCTPQPELCAEFEKDISALDTAYYQLKKEYATSADKEKILRAMMTNLQMQVQLMNRQLQIMETVKQKKEEIHTI